MNVFPSKASFRNPAQANAVQPHVGWEHTYVTSILEAQRAVFELKGLIHWGSRQQAGGYEAE